MIGRGLQEEFEILSSIFKEAAQDRIKAKQKLNAHRNNHVKKFKNGELGCKKSIKIFSKALELL